MPVSETQVIVAIIISLFPEFLALRLSPEIAASGATPTEVDPLTGASIVPVGFDDDDDDFDDDDFFEDFVDDTHNVFQFSKDGDFIAGVPTDVTNKMKFLNALIDAEGIELDSTSDGTERGNRLGLGGIGNSAEVLAQGDNLVNRLNVEVVLRDGIVEEIRGEI